MTMAFSIASNAAPPWLDVAISALPAGTVSLAVTRVWASTTAAIREDATVAGLTGRFVDYDVPVGWSVSYTVRAYSAAGALLETASTASTPVAAPDRGWAWISDPLAPRGALLLPTIIGTDSERTYAAPVRAVALLADPLPMVTSDVRGAAEAWPIWFGTRTDAEAEALLSCLRAGGTLLLRTGKSTLRHPTGLIFVGAPGVKRILYDGAEHSDWYATTFEARGPAIPSAVFPKSFGDVAALGGTFSNRKSANAGKTFLQESRG